MRQGIVRSAEMRKLDFPSLAKVQEYQKIRRRCLTTESATRQTATDVLIAHRSGIASERPWREPVYGEAASKSVPTTAERPLSNLRFNLKKKGKRVLLIEE